MNDEIKQLIKQFEDRLKDARIDQMTDDAMEDEEYKGYSRAYEEVILELKKSIGEQ
jgi:hypothetical protein